MIQGELEELIFKLEERKQLEWNVFSGEQFFAEFEIAESNVQETITATCQSEFSEMNLT